MRFEVRERIGGRCLIALGPDVALGKFAAVFAEAVVEHPTPAASEPTGPVIVGVRLKLDDQRLSEVESIVGFNTAPFFSTTGLVDAAPGEWERNVPPDQRATRGELTAVADAYLEARGNGAAIVPFACRVTAGTTGSKPVVATTPERRL